MPGEPPGNPHQPPPNQLGVWVVLGLAFVLTLGLFSVRCAQQPDTTRDYASRSLPPEPEPVLAAAPEMDDEYWPCSDCHEGEITNRRVRKLEDEHDEMQFEHGNLWCLHCHDVKDRDRLVLADSSTISFDESWKLCTQCHSQKLADWRAGVHGKRTGNWWGPKKFWTCVACHSPHSPVFKPLEPLPPPQRPEAVALHPRAAGAQETARHEAR